MKANFALVTIMIGMIGLFLFAFSSYAILDMVTVKGTAAYFDDNELRELPIRSLKVTIFDENNKIPDDEIATTYTNEQGEYDFSIKNIDKEDNSKRDLYVVFSFENDVLSIQDRSDRLYEFPSETVFDVPDGEIEFHLLLDQQDTMRGLGAIHNTIMKAHDFLMNKVGWERDVIQIRWPTSGRFSYYEINQIGLNISDVINIIRSDEWNRTAMFYYYGQAIMTSAYGNDLNKIPFGNYEGSHWVYTVSDREFAMSAGWAEFMEAAVDDNALNVTGYIDDDIPNIESNKWWTGDIDGNGRNTHGDIAEGAVASVFWDITDTAASHDTTPGVDDDGISDMFSQLWEILINDRPIDIIEFAGAWQKRNFDKYDELELIYETHGISLRPHLISIPKVESEAGSIIEASIDIDSDVENVGSINVTLTYDAELLTAKELVTIVAGFTVIPNLNEPGKVVIGAFSADGLGKTVAAGAIFKVKFEVNADAEGGSMSDLTLEEMILSDDLGEEIAVEVENGEFTVIGVVNIPPPADAGVAEIAAKVGEEIQFDGSASTDEDGTIISFNWDFGDGEVGEGEKVTHAYAEVGEYTVTLTVTDEEGAIGKAIVKITIVQPPQANFTFSPSEPREGLDVVTFKDTSTPQEEINSWKWDFDDGTTSTEKNPKHTYSADGSYKVAFQVLSSNGLESNITKNVNVTNVPPTAIIIEPSTTSTIIEGSTVNFIGDFTDPGSDDMKPLFEWKFGDGVEGLQGKWVAYQYSKSGTFTVTLTVTDSDGAKGESTLPVTVVKPPILVVDLKEGEVGELVTVDGNNFAAGKNIWEVSFGKITITQSEHGLKSIIGSLQNNSVVTDVNGRFSVQFSVPKSPSGQIEISIGDANSSFTVLNSPPSAPKVEVLPAQTEFSPVTTDNLKAGRTQESIDPNEDRITYKYEWFKNGEPTRITDQTVPSDKTAKEERWQVKVTPNDGLEAGPPGTAEVTVRNSPPSQPQVIIKPEVPLPFDFLTAEITEKSLDVDGDSVTYTYKWFKNGILTKTERTQNTEISFSPPFTKGEVWHVKVTPNDGEVDGTSAFSQRVTVSDIVVRVTISSSDGEQAFKTSVLKADVEVIPERLNIKFAYQWYNQNGAILGATSQKLTGKFSKHDKVYCRVTASKDPFSLTVLSNELEISNSPPSQPEVIINPSEPSPRDNLEVEIAKESLDADGDTNINYKYRWFKDGEPMENINDEVVPSSLTAAGQVWKVEVTPNDGESDGKAATSPPVTIGPLILFHNYPNPFNPLNGTRFVYYLERQANSVFIRVYDLRGKLIIKLPGTTKIGRNEVIWDGKDREGDVVPSAVFLCHIEISPEGERIQPNPLKIVAWR